MQQRVKFRERGRAEPRASVQRTRDRERRVLRGARRASIRLALPQARPLRAPKKSFEIRLLYLAKALW